MKDEICKVCGKGKYQHGSGLYDYYSCGHAFEKPLNSEENGRWVYFPSPYDKRCLNIKYGRIDRMIISEQVKKLREYAKGYENNPCNRSILDTEKILREAADTIESLSEKLQAANMERPAADCGGWIPCSERLPEESGYYLCTIFCEDGRVLVKTIYFNHFHIWIEDCTDVIYPDAWMPVPDPYHEP